MAGIKTGISGQINNNIVTDGLVFYVDPAYKKSYPGSGTTVNDLVGTIEGTFQNSPGFESNNNGIFEFDGSDDRISLTSSPNLSPGTGDFTFSIWANPTSYTGTYMGWFVIATTGGLWIGISNNNEYILRAYGVANIVSFSTKPTTGVWTNVTITRISNTSTIYYNAVSKGSNTDNRDYGQATGYIADDGGGTDYNGKFGPIMFYKGKGLTQAEVLQNYQAQKERFGL